MTEWDILIKCNICELPVDLRKICKKLGIGLYSYSQGYSLIQKLGLTEYTIGSDGFLFQNGDIAIAFYNPHCPVGRQKFTIAHELAHFSLGHASDNDVVRREPGLSDDPIEKEANAFAAKLLAPACVLRGLRVKGAYAIENYCGLSRQASEYCWEKLKYLYQLDQKYINEKGYSYFFLSNKEWKIYQQFKPFIDKQIKYPHRLQMA